MWSTDAEYTIESKGRANVRIAVRRDKEPTMKILEVDIQNMRTFPQQNWRVPTGVSLITGANGTGKSTLMGVAAAWTIWGKAPGRSQDYLVRHGEREMKCRVLISDNNLVFSIERRFLLSKSGKNGTTKLTFTQHFPDGKSSDKTGPINKETQVAINSLVGPYEVWAMTAYVGQREGAGQFLQSKGSERREVLRSLVSSSDEYWENLDTAAKNERDGTQRNLDRTEGSIEDLEQKVSEIPTLQGEVEACTSSAENTARIFAESSDELVTDTGALALAQEEEEAWDRLVISTAEDLAASKLALDAEMDANDALADQVNLSKELPDLEAKLKSQQDQVATREREIADVQATNSEIADRNVEKQSAFLEVSEAFDIELSEWKMNETENAQSRATDIAAHELHIKQCQEIASILSQIANNICIECRTPLTDEHSQELTDRQARILSEMNGEPDIDGAQAAIRMIQTYVSPDEPVRPVMEPAEPFIDLPNAFAVNDELVNKVVAARSASAEVERLTPVHAAAVEAKDKADEKYQHSKAISDEAGERPDCSGLEDKVNAQKRVVTNAQASNDEAKQLLTAAQTRLDSAMESKTTLTERRQKISGLKTDLYEWMQVTQATGKGGVRQLIIDQSVGAMETASNRWLQTIAPGFEIAFSTQTDTDQETFEEGVIMPSGVIQPWSELSGAQSVAVALAVRLALAEVGGSAYGVRYETVYLDEADAWLSGDYQLQFMDYISRVAATGIDVVAITHIEAVQDMIDQKTTIRAIDSETSEIR